MTKKISFLLLGFSVILAAYLRFYQLDVIPPGLHGDEVTQGYNTFSLLHTGKDKYGETLPVFFRSYITYETPVYTYLTMIPILIFGNTVVASRAIAAISGSLLVLVSYFFLLYIFNGKEKFGIASIGALIVAVSPWSIFFSRFASESSPGVTLFGLSILFFLLSLKNKYLFPVACFVLGLSTHAYYSEGLISLIFLPVFVLMFKKNFLEKWVILGLIIFTITQIPQILIFQSGALTNRFDQVGLFSKGKSIEAMSIFINNYLTYYSPRNLFFDSDTNLGRMIPGLSVFYNWMLVPFLVGLGYLLRIKLSNGLKILWLVLILAPVPAAITGDVFYPLRALDFLWAITLIVSLGIYKLIVLISSKKLRVAVLGFFLFYSLFSLYISYFILFKYEKSQDYGYAYLKLWDRLKKYPDKHIIVDSTRDPGIGLRWMYLTEYDPQKVQRQLRPQIAAQYYTKMIDTNLVYYIDNIEIKPIQWKESCRKNYLFVGDKLAISEENVIRHRLKLEFEIPDITGKVYLAGYSTDGDRRCSNLNER